MKYPFLLNKTYHEWPEPFITISQLRKVGKLNEGDEFFLKAQGKDESITEENPVDLARTGLEQIYIIKGEKYQFIVNGRLFVSHESIISEAEIRAVGKISPNETLYFRVEGRDRIIVKDQKIDLKPYPIEEFYSTSPKLVSITIDNKKFEINPGKYTVSQIKVIGSVSPSYDLDQLIDRKLIPLKDDGDVIIRGCEEFKSHPKDGSSS